MPRDVIMPALGMAQDSGVIVSWLKKPGDAVAEGDALFEVETDKATMEVEAQGKGYLTDVTAEAGQEVPVGQVIAQISETATGGGKSAAPESKPAPTEAPESEPKQSAAPEPSALPEGHKVIMPALGMAQDTGLIVSWQKAPGDRVGIDDVLFEVETDKAAMEVPAGVDGYVAALLAEAGEDIPVGDVVAIISADEPDAPFAQSTKAAPSVKAPAPQAEPAASVPSNSAPDKPQPPIAAGEGGRVLASPKARRLAMEQGLDLALLVQAGHPQPFHVADLDVLKSLPAPQARAASAAVGVTLARRLCAEIGTDGFTAFCAWAEDRLGQRDTAAFMAGFAAASLRHASGPSDGKPLTVAVESIAPERWYDDPDLPWLGQSRPEPPAADRPAVLRIRDLRHTTLTLVDIGAEDGPVLTLTGRGDIVTVTLTCDGDAMSGKSALTLLTEFTARLEQPLRHLL